MRSEFAVGSGSDPRDRVIILDDFFIDPEAVARHAKSANYTGFFDTRAVALPGLQGNYAALPPEPDLERFLRGFDRSGAPFLHRFQLNRARERCVNVHRDGCGWIAMVHLAAGHDGDPATCFYRHRKTGISRFERTELPFVAMATGRPQALVLEELVADHRKPEAWEVVLETEYRFNRAIVMYGDLMHATASFWGSTPEDGRLIHLMRLIAD